MIDEPTDMIVSELGLITWTPLEGVLSSGDVTLVVSDGQNQVEEDFIITVTPVNDNPYIFEPIEDINVDEDSDSDYIYLSNYFNDVDSELTYSVEENLDFIIASINGEELTIFYVPDLYGSGQVTVIASDGELSVENSFDLTVNNVNDIPIISEVDTLITAEDIPLEFVLVATDEETDASLQFTIQQEPEHGTLVQNTRALSFYTYTPNLCLLYTSPSPRD